jgi:hypothetical protein
MKNMKNILLILMMFIGTLGYSQCDTTLIAKEGTYVVRAIEEAMDYLNPTPRKLNCDELIYIEEIRSNKKIIIKLDDYTEVTIYPKIIYIQDEK